MKLRLDECVLSLAHGYSPSSTSSPPSTISAAISFASARDCVEVFREFAAVVLNVLHASFLCAQCHRDWGGDDNDDWDYLHRRGVSAGMTSFDDDLEDDDDDEEEEADDPDTPQITMPDDLTNAVADALAIGGLTSKAREEENGGDGEANGTDVSMLVEDDGDEAKLAKIESVKVALLSRNWRSHSKAIWAHASSVLTQIVGRMADGDMATVGADNMRRVVDCCRQLVSVVEDDFGADTHELSNAVSDLCRGFFTDVHAESVEIMMGMIDREDWIGVEVGRVRGRRGEICELRRKSQSCQPTTVMPTDLCIVVPPLLVAGLIKLVGLGRDRAAFNVKKDVMCGWPESGNPLQGDGVEDPEGGKEEEVVEHQKGAWPGSLSNTYSDDEGIEENSFWREVTHNWDQDPPMTTLTVLNGITKFIGKYIDIMRTLPSITTDVAAGMQRLVDSYYLAVVGVAIGGNQAEEIWGAGEVGNWMDKIGDLMHKRRLEMCKPVSAEHQEYAAVVSFIRRAKKKVGGLDVSAPSASYQAQVRRSDPRSDVPDKTRLRHVCL